VFHQTGHASPKEQEEAGNSHTKSIKQVYQDGDNREAKEIGCSRRRGSGETQKADVENFAQTMRPLACGASQHDPNRDKK